MAIYTSYGPNAIAWSKNFIVFTMTYNSFASGWQMQVEFFDPDTGGIVSTTQYPTANTSGSVSVYDAELQLKTIVKDSLPLAVGDTTIIQESTSNINSYQIRYRPYADGTNYPWTTDPTVYRLIKGGISSMNFNNEQFVNQVSYDIQRFLPYGKRFLSWMPQERAITPNEMGWLLYYSDSTDAQEVVYVVTFKDGTNNTIVREVQNNTGSYQYRTWYIPMGIAQAQLDPTNAGVWYVTVIVRRKSDLLVLDSYRYDIDSRPFYNSLCLYYRNSVGGLDHILLSGITEKFGASVEKKEYSKRRIGGEPIGAEPIYETQTRYKFSGSTKYISIDERKALSEIHSSCFCALLASNGAWLPMRVPAQELKAISSQDKLTSYKVEFETAGRFETMPRELMQYL